ncbi:putative nuclease HARBI1 [Acyrthosiphon pisum]|uniref:DDE Tnp4 domain-containing protein n=1 Tax=Acyrthosiphon pisum TaxID=7029 RepID=A0A8R2AEI9_ACYPI|nr:putative nuclease HARBI1 [Acyrthosiphon pisum]|eukprot:XP_001951832.2 PREDICTED: putative nuclease HARBI1 [Acyrthosiphon pisum]
MSSNETICAVLRVVEEIIKLKRHKKSKKKKIWVKNWIKRRNNLGASNTLLKELAVEDPRNYFNFLRINESMFNILLGKVKDQISKQDTAMREALTPRIKLEIALRFLATGDSYTSLQYLYRVSKSAISEFMPDVFDAIFAGLKEFIQVPKTTNDWDSIVHGFNLSWNFPNCFGAIDGKHIIIECPANSGSNFYNYKGSFSIVLLALVDHSYNFTCIDVGAYGSASDGGIFSKCTLKKAIEENQLNLPDEAVMLGDEAFPLTKYLMKPYPRRNILTKKQKIYNYRHCRARRIVENSFGILSSRFRVFRRPLRLLPSTVVKLVKAACSLHNWIRKSGLNQTIEIIQDIEDLENGILIPGQWRKEPQSTGVINIAATSQRNYLNEAKDKRDSLADYFMGEGAVTWQDRMIE